MADQKSAAAHTKSLLLVALLTSVMGGIAAHGKGYIGLYLAYMSGLTSLFAVYLFVPTLRDYRRAQGQARGRDIAIVLPLVVIIAVVMSQVLLGLGVGLLLAVSGLWEVIGFVRQHLPAKSILVALTAVATIIFGSLFFYFRLRQRFVYGVTEAGFGVLIAAHRMSTEQGTSLPSDTTFYFAVLTAGVYLVVRGLDNMHHGFTAKEPAAVLVASLPERLIGVASRITQR